MKLLIAIILIIAIISFFLPSQVKVERSLAMNAPIELVFSQVNTVKNFQQWSPWHKLDPNMEQTFEGPEFGVGAKYSWKSEHKNVGSGSGTIIESIPNTFIKEELDFMENGKAIAGYSFEKVQNGTKVTWSMEADMSKPIIIGKYFGLMMDKMLGKDFETGLANLKSLVENMPAEANNLVKQDSTITQ